MINRKYLLRSKEDLLLRMKRGTVSTSPFWGPEKTLHGRYRQHSTPNTWKPSCSLAMLEISQVSERKTSITLRLFIDKIEGHLR